MSKDTQAGTAPEQTGNILEAAGLPVTVHAQYVRDISFENPGAPESLRPGQSPEMNLNIGMDARKIPSEKVENLYETVLNVKAEAKRGEETVFIAEVLYGITVSIDPKVPEDNHHPLLLIEMPRLIFPYVRQILGDLTVKGGFPPLLLNPVDFVALYMQRFGKDMAMGTAEKDAKKK